MGKTDTLALNFEHTSINDLPRTLSDATLGPLTALSIPEGSPLGPLSSPRQEQRAEVSLNRVAVLAAEGSFKGLFEFSG